ncbi:TPA: hypothetical protein OUU25_000897 [Escherichia coli]|nr:hypothetical protein [Escherichia coli]
MNINVAELLNGNYILLLFVVLALGLCLGKLRLGSIQLGNSIGVLVVSLLLGQQHFSINTDALNLGFMLFIFCVGVEAGPNFFSIFFRDGKNYLMLALVMVGSALVIALGLGKLFGWDIGLTAGMLAGSMTSTPVLVGAGDSAWVAGVSVVLWGLGASLGFPLTISAASDTGPDAPTRVSVVATTGYLAFLVGPPLLGYLGEHYGLRSAMLVVLALVILAAIVAKAVAKPDTKTQTAMENS